MLVIAELFYLIRIASAGAISFDAFSEDPMLLAPGEALAQKPYNLTSDQEGLQKRDVGCYFQGTSGSFCDGAQMCCYNFEIGSAYGGFCCPNDGRCCGNGCCTSGYGCAYADHTTFQCCLDSDDSCGITTTVTDTVTDYGTVTAVETTVDVEYNTVTNYATAVETQDNTVRETKTEQNTVTKEASTIIQTQIFTSVNSQGQTIIQTTAVPSVISAASAASNTAECVGGSSKQSNVGAIVGGAVGGVAFIALLAAFLFIGARKGWFDKKQPAHPPVPVPVGAAGANNEPKHYYHGPEAVPLSPSGQTASHRNTMTPVPPYQQQPQPGYAQRPSFVNEMEGTGHGYEMPGNDPYR